MADLRDIQAKLDSLTKQPKSTLVSAVGRRNASGLLALVRAIQKK